MKSQLSEKALEIACKLYNDTLEIKEIIELFCLDAELAPPVQLAQYHDLEKRLADLQLYEEITEHYAKCNPTPESLRDWVAERMDRPAQPVQQMSQFDRMVLQGINPATFLPPIMTQPKETK